MAEENHDAELMGETKPSPPKSDLSEFWRTWVENPGTQAWVAWQKWLWAINPFSQLIPLDFEEIWRAFVHLGDDLAAHPELLQEKTAVLLRQYNELYLWTMQRWLGKDVPEPLQSFSKDRRFQDEAWVSNLFFSAVKQSYLIMASWFTSAAQNIQTLDENTYKHVNFYIRQFTNALSPSNFWLTNPSVLRETLDTGGENLRRGMQNLIDDLRRGAIKVVGRDQFTVGENLALSPGQVILRNELVELIQYSPETEETYKIPLLFIPPWINKYYVLDIRPGRSFVEYLVAQGFTVFMISWRNPDQSLQDKNLEDYLRLGPLDCLEAVKSICQVDKINLIGYCLGGTLLSITLAFLAANKDTSANSGTFFASLQDFTEVGETAIFISQEQINKIEQRMESKGYLDALEMASIFNLMRSNDLIWNFVVNNYLLGREPMAFDLMYWSVDGTRMPRAMHSFYLRNMYLENNLVKPGSIKMIDTPIDLHRIRIPSYVVAGLNDHIVPWRSAHSAATLFRGKTHRILSYGGHITSIINQPEAQRSFYYTNASDTEEPNEWLKTATRNQGSWWPDWVSWLGNRSKPKVSPPSIGNSTYPIITPAPGTYVLEE